jgi:signal transduction histidine kinase
MISSSQIAPPTKTAFQEGVHPRGPRTVELAGIAAVLLATLAYYRSLHGALLACSLAIFVTAIVAWNRARMLERRCAELESTIAAHRALAVSARRRTARLIAADVAHDLAAPVRFFEDLLQQLTRGRPIEPEDVSITSEEVARLRRLLRTMRELEFRGAIPTPTRVRPVVEEALRGTIAAPQSRVPVEISDTLVVRAEAASLRLAISCLLSNAERVAGDRAIGIAAYHHKEGNHLEVWNEGDVPSDAVINACFRPWGALRPDGSGLGVALAARLARSFGWRLTHVVREGRTRFRLEIPEGEIVAK